MRWLRDISAIFVGLVLVSPSLAFLVTTPRFKPRYTGPLHAKKICFEASKTLSTMPFEKPDCAASFLQSEASIIALFGEDTAVENKGGGIWRAAIPTNFPGLKVIANNFFIVSSTPEYLSLELLNSTSTAEGPPFLVRIYDAAQSKPPKTSSKNIVTIVETDEKVRLNSEVSLQIEMEIPSWVPIPAGVLERKGSEALEKMMETDVKPKLDGLRDKLLSL